MRRLWWYLVISVCLAANVVSLKMGGTHPTFPDTTVWMVAAAVTSAVGVVYVLRPTHLMLQVVPLAVGVCAGTRAVGAIFWNPQLWSKFGGGSLWTMLFVFSLVAHRWLRHKELFDVHR